MADIEQKLGFDAKQAIQEITALNQALSALNSMLGDTGTTIQSWNAVGSTAVTQFTSMKNAADAARKAIDALTAAQNQATIAASKSTTGPTAVLPTTPLPQFDQYRDQIQQLANDLGKIPANVSQSSQRAYASAISSLADFAVKNKVSMQDLANAWQNPQAVVSGAANTLANKAQQVKTAFADMANSSKNNLGAFTISWETFARVIQTQLIVRSIYALVQAFQDGIRAAIDFGKRVSEIGTILGKPFAVTQQDLKDVEQGILALSRTYGSNIKDVAEGYYQVLSNQVGNASESMYVLETAMKFGVATNSTLTASVDLLTAAINGYQLGAAQAAEISGVLFRAVELGRFHASELANILGRVGPVAHEMGVGLEETMAALTTMTIAGVRADTAVTQLRGVMTQLLKPTKELKDLMQNKWGVENAQEAIAAFGGLVPLLQALDREANGNVTTMAEFFKNVRALTGVLQVTGESSGRLSHDLDILNNSGRKVLDWATNLVMDTPAKRAEIAITRLKDAFIEMGSRALPAVAELLNGLNKVIDVLGHFSGLLATIPIALAAGGMLVLGQRILGVTSVVQGLTVALSRAWPILVAIAAFEATEALKRAAKGPDIGAELKERYKALEDLKNKQQEFTAERVRADAHMYDVLKTEAAQYFAVLTKLSESSTKAATGHFTAYATVVKRTTQDIVKTVEAELARVESIIADHTKNQIDLAKQIYDVQLGYEDRIFELKTNRLDEIGQINAKEARGESTLRQALAQLSQATDKVEIDAIKERIDYAHKFGVEITNAQAKGGFDTGMSRLEKDALDAKIAVTQRQSALEKAAYEQAQAALPDVLKKYEDIKQTQKDIEEGLKKIASSKSLGDWKKNLEDIQAPLKHLAEVTGAGLIDLKDTKILGVEALNNRLKAESARIAPLEVHAKVVLEGIKDSLQQGLKAVPTEARAGYPEAQSAIELSRAFETDRAKAESLKKQITELGPVMTQLKGQGEATAEALTKLRIPDVTRTQILAAMTLFDRTGKEIEASARAQAEFNTLIENTQLLVKKVDLSSGEGQKTYIEWLSAVKAFGDAHPEAASKVKTLVERVRELISEEAKITQGKGNVSDLQRQLDEVNKRMEPLAGHIEKATQEGKTLPGLKEFFDTFKTGKDDTAALSTNLGEATTAINNAVGPARDLEAALNGAAYASSEINYAAFASTGGMMHLAGGGPSGRGTDTIPAMLSPGEFVMNAKASRTFFSQLVAMNAGISPMGHSTGGSVTNIGDINVSVSGSESSRQTGRDIAAAIRRELRRGTSTLS